MALIEEGNPAVSGDKKRFWEDQLKNSYILLYELDKAILALERKEEESYTVDTGQTTFTARRQNLPELIRQRASLISQIQSITAAIEIIDSAGSNFTQVVPF
ncbi:MAG: hypothetical protein LBP37_04290 [Spirochaetaceae bacterium]|jgi:hypothetical protein|nr:hypothetical protein [Spirochaetaceae bacterium]